MRPCPQGKFGLQCRREFVQEPKQSPKHDQAREDCEETRKYLCGMLWETTQDSETCAQSCELRDIYICIYIYIYIYIYKYVADLAPFF
jgi:hypothetical protein